MLKKLALACLLAAPALASAASGAYLVAGGAMGSTDMQDIEKSYSPPYTTDDSFGRAVIGLGVNASPYLAVEGLYLSKAEGTVEDSAPASNRDTLEHSGLQISVLGKAPLTPQLNVFGRLSSNYLKTTYTYENSGATVYSSDKTKPYLGFGFGAAFQVNDAVGLRLQWERIMIQDVTVLDGALNPVRGNFDVDQTSLAVTFNF